MDQKLIQCEHCGFMYDSLEPFVRKSHYLVDPAKTYCKSCVGLAIDTTLIKYFFYRLMWIGYALFAYHVQGYPQLAWLVVNLVLMGFLGFFVVLLHELGHALTALALKLRLYGIEVGQGHKLLSFKVFSYPITINKLPFLGGFTYVGFRDKEESVWKMSLVYLAGPVTNLLIFLVILGFVGIEELIDPVAHGFKGIEIFTIIAFDNIVNFIRNIIPRSFVAKGIKVDNDGKFLLRSLFKRGEIKKSLRISTLSQHGNEACQHEDYSEAAKWFKKGIDEFPDTLLFQHWYAASLYVGKQYQEALAYLDSIIDEDLGNNEDTYYSASIYNLYAWITFLGGDKSKLEIADKYSNKACKILEGEAHILDTRGCLDIELGEILSGKKLLWKAIEKTPVILFKASGLCCLAIAEIKSGDLERARFIHQLIFKMELEPELLPRLSSMLEEAG